MQEGNSREDVFPLRLRKTVGSRLLEVVTRTEGSKIIVITAYYLKE